MYFPMHPNLRQCTEILSALGKGGPTKTDEFSEKFRRGGSFPIQKFILQIFAIINGTSVMNSGKNPQYDFPKMRGEDQRPSGIFRKFIRFGRVRLP